MRELLIKLGFSEKEAEVYLLALEIGNQPASVLAKKLKMPRPTVLFILENLSRKGYLRKSHRGRTQYFYADPTDIEKVTNADLAERKATLAQVAPLLKEYKNPYTSPPKLNFFEGIDGCRKAYGLILEQKEEVREFATHLDLEKMGVDFMENFIKQRTENGIFMRDLCMDTPEHRRFQKLDKKQMRESVLFDAKVGNFYSSISVFGEKVLILNLYGDPFAILIESKQLAETMVTIHKLGRREGAKELRN